jgi:hypothetical protein
MGRPVRYSLHPNVAITTPAKVDDVFSSLDQTGCINKLYASVVFVVLNNVRSKKSCVRSGVKTGSVDKGRHEVCETVSQSSVYTIFHTIQYVRPFAFMSDLTPSNTTGRLSMSWLINARVSGGGLCCQVGKYGPVALFMGRGSNTPVILFGSSTCM